MHLIAVQAFLEKLEQPVVEHWGYIWGQRGQVWTEALQAAADRDMTIKYGSKWIGRRVADCSGLIKWALIELGNNCAHGSNSIWKRYLSLKSTISDDGSVPAGALVFKARGTDMYHVGVHIGNGIVVEAKSTRDGVVRRNSIKEWTHWGWLNMLLKEGETEEMLNQGEATVKASTGSSVRMRKAGSIDSDKVANVLLGTKVNVLSSDGEWAKISLEGYMMEKFLEQ